MADYSITNKNLLVLNGRVFVPSEKINIFPCARRGQYSVKESPKYYDPEARLNTERTNRLHTAINGFKDKFIVKDTFTADNTLVFVLAGYYIEIKGFNPADVATALGMSDDDDTISAHLSLHTEVSLDVKDYYTEILYKQSTRQLEKNTLDVSYTDDENKITADFFVGVSFIKESEVTDEVSEGTSNGNNTTRRLPHYELPLFTKDENDWVLVQTSLLPKIEHDVLEDSIKVFGDATFNTNIDVQNKATITTVEVPYSVDGLEGTTTITTGGIGTPYIYAKALAADGIAVGGEISIVDDLDPEKVEKRTTIGHTKDANGEYTQDGIYTTNITASGSITTPIIDVTTIQNTDTTSTAVKVDDDLNVTGNSTIGSNLNVGTPITPANANNGGYIVAKKDITAEHDLIAQNDLTVTNHAQTKTLEILETAEVRQTLNVQKANSTDDDAVANIDSAVVGSLIVSTTTTTSTLEATTSIKTPALDVKSIENNVDATGININDNLNVAPGHAVTADTLNVNTVNSRQENGTITVGSPVALNGKATLKDGLEVAAGDTTLKKLAAESLEVTNSTTLNNGLTVTNGDTALQTMSATELTVATDALTVTQDTATFKKPVTVDSNLTANNLQINDQGQVAAVELARIADEVYQLRFKFGTTFEIKDERPKTTE